MHRARGWDLAPGGDCQRWEFSLGDEPVDLCVVGRRAGRDEAEPVCCQPSSCTPCPLLQSVAAQISSCRAQKLEHELGEPGWRMPHGGGWDPTTSSLLLTLARALPADGSAPELDKPRGNHCIICYVPSVPPLTPPSSKCHRHQGRNISLSGTERE